jgi:hypothetical protein
MVSMRTIIMDLRLAAIFCSSGFAGKARDDGYQFEGLDGFGDVDLKAGRQHA